MDYPNPIVKHEEVSKENMSKMKLAYDAHKAAGGADVESNGGCFCACWSDAVSICIVLPVEVWSGLTEIALHTWHTLNGILLTIQRKIQAISIHAATQACF